MKNYLFNSFIYHTYMSKNIQYYVIYYYFLDRI
jgi:hypothetical protein